VVGLLLDGCELFEHDVATSAAADIATPSAISFLR